MIATTGVFDKAWQQIMQQVLDGQLYTEFPQITFLPGYTRSAFGRSANIDSLSGLATPMSNSSSSQENGSVQMSETVAHNLKGEHGWFVQRGTSQTGTERFTVRQGNRYIAEGLTWLEAYKEVEDFINEAEMALNALLDLATYNRDTEPAEPPTAALKARKAKK